MVLRVLNVAEKPSAAKEIVHVLRQGGPVTTRNGYSMYNRIFEFDMPLNGSLCRMVFTSVTGHLKETDFEAQYRKWGSCDPAALLDPNATRIAWTVREDKEDIVRTLRAETRHADWLILWLDCDSEGEKIAFDVREVCLSAKRNILVKRARFSAMTRGDLLRAVAHLEQLNERLARMVETRQEIDLRAGSAYTRFLTISLERFNLDISGQGRAIVSYGPCQFPTLGLVVDRWLTIQHFVRRPFWVFTLRLVGTEVPFEWARKQLFDEYSAHLLYEIAVEQSEAEGSVAHVVNVNKRNKSRWRPLPLSTVELQKAASRLLRISSDKLMDVAESLYNKGLISYPRTETDQFSETYNLKGLIQKQTGHPEWGNFANRLLTPASQQDIVTFMWPRSGGHDDGAHPPIHPTEAAPASFDSDDHRKVYMYVAKRFLACCSVDAQGAETSVQVRVGEAEFFGARGLIIEHKGYLEVMHPLEKWSERDMPPALLNVGTTLPWQSFTLRESQTQPPPLLSEADLIALMDHYGIGTDATIAEHIRKVQERNYVMKEEGSGGRFAPTEIGIALVVSHEKCQLHLARPHMRANQEEDLKKVGNGQAQAASVLEAALTEYSAKFSQLRNNTETLSNVFRSRFNVSTAATWRTLVPNLSECGRCHELMDLKGRPGSAGAAPRGSVRGRGGGRGRSRGRGRGGGFAHARANEGSDRSLHCRMCSMSHKLPRFGIIEAHEARCPVCQFQVLQMTNSSSNARHTICPYCISNPPSNEAVNPEKKMADFRCFMCTHPTCGLSQGMPSNHANVAECPLCKSPCNIRESRNGESKFISCSAGRESCNFVYFFPGKVVQSVAAAEGAVLCGQCGSRNISVTWKRSRVPLGTPINFTGCIWCDCRYHDTLRSAGAERDIPKSPHPGSMGHGDIEDIVSRGRRWVRGRGAQRGNIGGQRQTRGGSSFRRRR